MADLGLLKIRADLRSPELGESARVPGRYKPGTGLAVFGRTLCAASMRISAGDGEPDSLAQTATDPDIVRKSAKTKVFIGVLIKQDISPRFGSAGRALYTLQTCYARPHASWLMSLGLEPQAQLDLLNWAGGS